MFAIFKKNTFTVLIIIALTKNILAQDSLLNIYKFPSEREITFNLLSTVNLVNNHYEYNYSISSLLSSDQDITRFMIENFSNVLVINSPSNWSGGHYITSKETVSWHTIDSTSRVQPSETLNGFSYKSDGLPIISNSFSSGYVYIPDIADEPVRLLGVIFSKTA
jgi:hypothetical protein